MTREITLKLRKPRRERLLRYILDSRIVPADEDLIDLYQDSDLFSVRVHDDGDYIFDGVSAIFSTNELEVLFGHRYNLGHIGNFLSHCSLRSIEDLRRTDTIAGLNHLQAWADHIRSTPSLFLKCWHIYDALLALATTPEGIKVNIHD